MNPGGFPPGTAMYKFVFVVAAGFVNFGSVTSFEKMGVLLLRACVARGLPIFLA